MIPTADDDGTATDCDITATYAIVYNTVRYNTECCATFSPPLL